MARALYKIPLSDSVQPNHYYLSGPIFIDTVPKLHLIGRIIYYDWEINLAELDNFEGRKIFGPNLVTDSMGYGLSRCLDLNLIDQKACHFYWCIPGMLETYTILK